VENLDPTVEMTQVVSVSPVNPHFAARHAVASAVLVPVSRSAEAPPSPDLVFTNVVVGNEANQSPTATQPDIPIPVAMVIPQN
jgi:hypothetical protein